MSVIDFGIKSPDDFSPISDEILEETIIPQFERIVKKYPDRMAVKDSTLVLTYQELNNAINNLAHWIINEMSDDKSPIAFLLGNEVFAIIVFMAVLKSGRPYVGLHPGNSNEQLRSFLEDSTASLLITSAESKETAETLLNNQKQIKVLYFDEIQTNSEYENPEYHVAPNDLFGIFYTSGTTGTPKGIMSGHLYKSQSAQYMNNSWFFSPSDRIPLLTSVCYGASYPSVFGAFLSGALLCIFDLKANSAQKALDWIISEELTVFRCTPSIFRTVFGLVPNELIFSKLRFITLGGESITETDIELFKAHTAEDCVLINNFSSTETGSMCHYPVHHNLPPFQGFLPAGYPAPGKEIMLLDNNGQQTQTGQAGEIIVRSQYLSFGYWRQPELTNQKFRIDPSDPKFKIYFSGDYGRWRDDGTLEVLGRADTQVKIRGYRVQLEAVDTILRSLTGVKDAATIVHGTSGSERLVAYLSMTGNEKISVNQLKKELSVKLSDYMIPSLFIQMDALPRTATGKLARHELPKPTNDRPELDTPYKSPHGELQLQIASVWQKVLGLEQVGINDSFFELGGDSLLALQMTLEVEKATSRTISQAFFKEPTIASLATLLEANISSSTNNERFVIESYRKDGQQNTKTEKRKRGRGIKLTKVISRMYSLSDLDRLIDLLVARNIVSKSFPEALQWTVQWSQNTLVRDLLYRRRYALFTRWVASLKDCNVLPSNAFQMSLLTNMNFGLQRYLGKKERSVKSDLQAYKRSRYPYWRTLGELLDKAPYGQMNEYFPVSGVEHLSQAHQQGTGVVLLSFHGVPTPGRFFALERFMELDPIPTISYHIPIWQSEYHDRRDEMPVEVASTLNAEVALFAQRKLQEGKIINIVSDTNDIQGRTHKVSLAGRAYRIKSGFAELAINTGAVIVPHYRHCLPNGRIQLSLGAPLEPGTGDRQQQVENLLGQYTAFIEHAWATHPEAMRWIKINKHLARPLA